MMNHKNRSDLGVPHLNAQGHFLRASLHFDTDPGSFGYPPSTYCKLSGVKHIRGETSSSSEVVMCSREAFRHMGKQHMNMNQAHIVHIAFCRSLALSQVHLTMAS